MSDNDKIGFKIPRSWHAENVCRGLPPGPRCPWSPPAKKPVATKAPASKPTPIANAQQAELFDGVDIAPLKPQAAE